MSFKGQVTEQTTVKWSIHGFLFFLYGYGAPLGGPWGRRSSAILNIHFRPDMQAVYAAKHACTLYMQQVAPAGVGLKIEGILFQELPTTVDDNRYNRL